MFVVKSAAACIRESKRDCGFFRRGAFTLIDISDNKKGGLGLASHLF